MSNATPPAALSLGMRISRAVHRASRLNRSGESTNAALDRLGIRTLRHDGPQPFGSRSFLREGRLLVRTNGDVRHANLLVRAIDAGVPGVVAGRLVCEVWS